ncbi:carboxypeptidase-like regulatory domain-containing protein [Larkinella insperata]|uniref:Carboxypeptidase-like regulatory domain-containing protein n=1 Tax=Larkinella insperata TaxID=332158 RepID=A0ABW3QNI3_9BACT|nr:carboxypeptidase-like regulatory domain-containing protein [Larkinella insperata]
MKQFLMMALLGAVACTKPGVEGPQAPAKVEQGIVQGRVVDSQGQGVANAEIIANSKDIHDKTVTGHTDAQGNYRFKVPTGIAEGSYTLSGSLTVKYHNRNYRMALYQEDTRAFSPYEGVVRNFVFRLTGKRTADDTETATPLGATLEVYHDVNNLVFENIELTLEPEGPLVDGSTGKKIVTMMPQGDYHVKDIPLGKYKISARDKVTGQRLGVSVQDSSRDYAASVTALFEDEDFEGSEHFRLGLLVGVL